MRYLKSVLVLTLLLVESNSSTCMRDETECTANCNNGQCTMTSTCFSCNCFQGFQYNGNHCEDINECTTYTDLCANGNCINTIGGFCCECNTGFAVFHKFLCIETEFSYEYFETWLTWNEAQQVCRRTNGTLASPTTKDLYRLQRFHQSVWKERLFDDVWIGLYQDNGTNNSQWTDGKIYNPSIHPVKTNASEQMLCYVLKISNWTLQPTRCSSNHSFICQRLTPANNCTNSTRQSDGTSINPSTWETMYTADVAKYSVWNLTDNRFFLHHGDISKTLLIEINCYHATINYDANLSGITENQSDLPAGDGLGDTRAVAEASESKGVVFSERYYRRINFRNELTIYNFSCQQMYDPTACIGNSCHPNDFMWLKCIPLTKQSADEVEKKAEAMQSNISVSKTGTKAYEGKHISRPDSRQSVKAVGSVGITLLVIPIVAVVAFDSPRLIGFIRKIYQKWRRSAKIAEFKRRLWTSDPCKTFEGHSPIYSSDLTKTNIVCLEEMF